MPGSENSTATMFYVYVIESNIEGKLYIGLTNNLDIRLSEHNRGLNFPTKPYRSWAIIHIEGYLNREDAHRRENYLKTSQGSRLLRRMLKEYFYQSKIKK